MQLADLSRAALSCWTLSRCGVGCLAWVGRSDLPHRQACNVRCGVAEARGKRSSRRRGMDALTPPSRIDFNSFRSAWRSFYSQPGSGPSSPSAQTLRSSIHHNPFCLITVAATANSELLYPFVLEDEQAKPGELIGWKRVALAVAGADPR